MKHLWTCLFVVLVSSLAFFTLNGCKASHASGDKPAVLHYAFSAQSEQMEGGGLRTELMRKYLEQQLHMPVQVVRVEGYAPAIEAMRTEKIDVANFGSLSYLIAAQKAGAQAITARGNPDGAVGGYRSVIAVPKNSPYHSLADLKAHAKDIVFAFADPASTSGNLYPRVGLLNAGIEPEKDFKKVVFAGGHPASVMTVKSGKVDAGAFMESAPRRFIKKNQMAADDIRIIWTSDLIPNGCYAVRKALPEQLKKDIQTALTSIPTKDPELWSHMTSLYNSVLTSNSGTVNVAVSDATYDGLRKYASQVKDFNFVEK